MKPIFPNTIVVATDAHLRDEQRGVPVARRPDRRADGRAHHGAGHLPGPAVAPRPLRGLRDHVPDRGGRVQRRGRGTCVRVASPDFCFCGVLVWPN